MTDTSNNSVPPRTTEDILTQFDEKYLELTDPNQDDMERYSTGRLKSFLLSALASQRREVVEQFRGEIDNEIKRWNKKVSTDFCRYAAGRLAATKHFASRWGFYDFGKEKDHSHSKLTPTD